MRVRRKRFSCISNRELKAVLFAVKAAYAARILASQIEN